MQHQHGEATTTRRHTPRWKTGTLRASTDTSATTAQSSLHGDSHRCRVEGLLRHAAADTDWDLFDDGLGSDPPTPASPIPVDSSTDNEAKLIGTTIGTTPAPDTTWEQAFGCTDQLTTREDHHLGATPLHHHRGTLPSANEHLAARPEVARELSSQPTRAS